MGVSLKSKSINVYSVFGVEFSNRESAENFSIELKESVNYKYYTIYLLPTFVGNKELYRRGILFGVANSVPYEEMLYRLMDLYGRMYKLDEQGKIYHNILIEEVTDIDDYKLAQIINNPLVIFDHTKLSDDSLIDASIQRIETIGKVHIENKRSKGIKFNDDLGDAKVNQQVENTYQEEFAEETQTDENIYQNNQEYSSNNVQEAYVQEQANVENLPEDIDLNYYEEQYYNVNSEIQEEQSNVQRQTYQNPPQQMSRQSRLNQRKKPRMFDIEKM